MNKYRIIQKTESYTISNGEIKAETNYYIQKQFLGLIWLKHKIRYRSTLGLIRSNCYYKKFIVSNSLETITELYNHLIDNNSFYYKGYKVFKTFYHCDIFDGKKFSVNYHILKYGLYGGQGGFEHYRNVKNYIDAVTYKPPKPKIEKKVIHV